MNPSDAIEQVFDLYTRFGDEDYIGEPVSQVEHMVQAGLLAAKNGHSEEVILAAFFHDIGHICAMDGQAEKMGLYGVKSHEEIGAAYLRSRGFSEIICRLVENHVAAKRYLTFADENYYNKLSEASKKTLGYQGGRMTAEEAASFSSDPLFKLSIELRFWDEEAKEEHMKLPSIDYFREMALRHLEAQTHLTKQL